MKYTVLITLLMITGASALNAQDLHSDRNMIVYDPLFWKDQLKLDNSQCLRIREINSSFYRKLNEVVNEPNRREIQAKAAQSLLERSEEIWETFHPRQRRKWKKIAHETAI